MYSGAKYIFATASVGDDTLAKPGYIVHIQYSLLVKLWRLSVHAFTLLPPDTAVYTADVRKKNLGSLQIVLEIL